MSQEIRLRILLTVGLVLLFAGVITQNTFVGCVGIALTLTGLIVRYLDSLAGKIRLVFWIAIFLLTVAFVTESLLAAFGGAFLLLSWAFLYIQIRIKHRRYKRQQKLELVKQEDA